MDVVVQAFVSLVDMANVVTIIRLLLIPAFVYFMVSTISYANLWALVILCAAVATDWIDGFIARRMGKVTAFGRLADPLVDRILILSAVITFFLTRKTIPFWALFLIFTRDLTMGFTFLYLRQFERELTVSFAGKISTACLMISFILMLFYLPFASWLFFIGLILYLFSALDYILKGRRMLSQKA